ncbi:hypothetical protein NDN08_005739 [Rhodosorus marinus]|uniref:TFIIF beta subunit HTH domain-containing protein n=1 Tax=Rhodosorus marinus TaxID=101924 RepID=A0AAV8V5H1_9RHOD|nr:hypothetical protein NDN08_005739 [Rhodosorus marinus]
MKRGSDEDGYEEDDDGFGEFAAVEEGEKVVGKRTGEVDFSSYGRGLYLVKVPARVIDALKKGDEGKLRLPTAADEETGIAKGELLLGGDAAEHPTSKFEVQIKPEAQDVIVFSSDRKDDDGKVRIEGKVSHQCVARPVIDSKFRSRLKQNVKSKAAAPQRKMQILNDEEYRKAEHRVVKIKTAQEIRELKYQREQKRRYVDLPEAQWKERTTTRLFQLFEKRSHWSLTEIADALDEPQQRLKALLGEACVYNKSGPHRNMYELRDEFKTVEQRKQKEDEIEARREARLAEQEKQRRLREEKEAYEKQFRDK